MKKGFTLIELLAVIVILAIIAVIAVPIVLNIINETKENANQRSIEMYKKAVENAFALSLTTGNSIPDGYYRGSRVLTQGDTSIEVEYDGEDIYCLGVKFKDGKVELIECNVGEESNLHLDEYVLEKNYGAQIGDYVNYDPTNNGTVTGTYTSPLDKNGYGDQVFDMSSYSGLWRIVGIEGDKIKLTTTDLFEPISGGIYTKNTQLNRDHYYYALHGVKGYINGVDELNNISAMFGKGEYAEGARSINFEDITNIVYGFDEPKATYADDYLSNSGVIFSYGNIVSCKFSEDGTTVLCTSSNGSTLQIQADYFYFYDKDTKTFINKDTADKSKTYVLKNNITDYHSYLYYDNKWSDTEISVIKEGWFWVLYAETSGTKIENYWVATQRNYSSSKGYFTYGLFRSYSRKTETTTLCKPKLNSTTNVVELGENTDSYGVRPVVILEEGTKLIKESEKTEKSTTYNVWNLSK